MGQFSAKPEDINPFYKVLLKQVINDLSRLPEKSIRELARKFKGGWVHKDNFIKAADRLIKGNDIVESYQFVIGKNTGLQELYKLTKDQILQNQKELISVFGELRMALVILIKNKEAKIVDESFPDETWIKWAQSPKALEGSPKEDDYIPLFKRITGSAPEAKSPKNSDQAQEIKRLKHARDNELKALKRSHENDLEKLASAHARSLEDLKRERQSQESQIKELHDGKTKLQDDAAKLQFERDELKKKLEDVQQSIDKRGRELSETMLSEEIRPWFVDARKLREASEEFLNLRQLTSNMVEQINKANREVDPFLAKENELRQAIPQMEDMLSQLRRSIRKAGQSIPAAFELEKRLQEHIEKVRHELDRLNHANDSFVEKIVVKIKEADREKLESIELALKQSVACGIMDSRHSDICLSHIHERKSYLNDKIYEEEKPKEGPMARLRRAIFSPKESARIGIDANNFICLQEAYLKIKVPQKKNLQGEIKKTPDNTMRQKLVDVLERLNGERTHLSIWCCFDGKEEPLKPGRQVKTTFTRPGGKADYDLMNLVAKDKSSTGRWFIISDDREVTDACQREGAECISSHNFKKLLIQDLKIQP